MLISQLFDANLYTLQIVTTLSRSADASSKQS